MSHPCNRCHKSNNNHRGSGCCPPRCPPTCPPPCTLVCDAAIVFTPSDFFKVGPTGALSTTPTVVGTYSAVAGQPPLLGWPLLPVATGTGDRVNLQFQVPLTADLCQGSLLAVDLLVPATTAAAGNISLAADIDVKCSGQTIGPVFPLTITSNPMTLAITPSTTLPTVYTVYFDIPPLNCQGLSSCLMYISIRRISPSGTDFAGTVYVASATLTYHSICSVF